MRAVLYAGEGQVSVETVADPGIEAPTDAVVRVRRSAVCGTDLHLVAHGEQVPRGSVLGHEYVGEIVAVGAAVLGHRVGDVVGRSGLHGVRPVLVVSPPRPLGVRGAPFFFGTGTAYGPALAGAQAELVRVPHADTVLRAVPEGVELDAAVFLGGHARHGLRRCPQGARPSG